MATAPGENASLQDGDLAAGPSDFVGATRGALVRAEADGEIWLDGASLGRFPGARAWAAGDAGIVVGTESTLSLVGAWAAEVPGLGAVGIGAGRVLAVVCEERCVARGWGLDGRELGDLAAAGAGGAVGEWEGIAWAGDPDESTPDAPGAVCAEDGRCVEGLAGDHLGSALGGGYAAGAFNKWAVPARGRVVPLGDGPTYALERGGENQPIVVAGDGQDLVVGHAQYPRDELPSGAIAWVR